MQIIYKQAESKTKPAERDVISSPEGVFLNRNIKEVITIDESGNESKKYTYETAFLSKDDYEQAAADLLVNQINGEDNTPEYEEYKNKLNTGVEYTNGHYYKPKWIATYSSIIDEFAIKANLYEKAGGDITPMLGIKTAVYDVTGKSENAVLMSVVDVIELWLFLYQIKEKYFAEYKKAVSGLNSDK